MTACLLFGALLMHAAHADVARDLFKSHQHEIFQIRVIELASGNKSSIGSGFLISDNGHIATNYHVVSMYVQKPDRYRIEYVDHENRTGGLSVMDIDVVHDLAIIKADIKAESHLLLDASEIAKGTRIYSMGNPHDLGMSIIEGTYNGLLEKTLYDKIFFSGSLNPGMSGGPAINRDGKVIGINVSTAGNELSFLVPVSYLINLFKEAQNKDQPLTDFSKRIEQQIAQHQSNYLNRLLESKWPEAKFGNAILPGKIANLFKCWGDSDINDEALIEHSYSHCMSEDHIYLANRYTTGGIAYTYDLYKKKKTISSLHFYNIYNRHFGQVTRVNIAKKEDVSNYECNTNFVHISDRDWKVAFCARRNVKYKSIYDIIVAMALTSEADQGLVIQLAIAGITKPMALKFSRRFMDEVRWQN
jgi:serine protease Do